MLTNFLELHEGIINITFNTIMKHIVEIDSHRGLLSGTGIFKTKWHDHVVDIVWGPK